MRRLASFRAFARWHGYPEVLSEYTAPRVERGNPHPLVEGIDGIRRMLKVAPTKRKQALVAFIGLCGMRVSEARSITPNNIDPLTQTVRIVHGKGSKQRTIPISAEAWQYIAPAMWLADDPNESIVGLSDSAARRAFTRLAEKAGLQGKPSSHDGRATLATGMLNNGGNLRVVQEMLGHADPGTTAIYTQVTMDDMRKAATL
jgi:site-specific recombinase XerD